MFHALVPVLALSVFASSHVHAVADDVAALDPCTSLLVYDLSDPSVPAGLDRDEVLRELLARGLPLRERAVKDPIRYDPTYHDKRRGRVYRALIPYLPEVGIWTYALRDSARWPLYFYYRIVERELEAIAYVSGKTWPGYENLIDRTMTPNLAGSGALVGTGQVEFERFGVGKRPPQAAPTDVGYVRVVYAFPSDERMEDHLDRVAGLLVTLRQ